MTKKITKIIILVILSAVIIFEVGYIINRNILNDNTSNSTIEITPEPIPVVGKDDENDDAKEKSKIIVIDPGHGKPSSLMSDEEKQSSGWVQNSDGDWENGVIISRAQQPRIVRAVVATGVYRQTVRAGILLQMVTGAKNLILI